MHTYLLSSESCICGLAYAPDTQTAVDVYEKSVKKFIDNLDPDRFSKEDKSRELEQLLDLTSIEVSPFALDITHCTQNLEGICIPVWQVTESKQVFLRPGREIKDVLTPDVTVASLSFNKALICRQYGSNNN